MSAVATDIVEEILDLKERRNAIILAHNYQVGPIQDLADFVGDSLGLSYKASETDAEVIAFCGVHFMGETAKIINPSKTVVIPDMDAGCSLSDSCPPEDLAAFLAATCREELLRHRLHQLQRRGKGAGGRDLHQRQRRQDRRKRPQGSANPFCSRSKSWLLGHGEDRPQNGSLAGQLLRPRRVHPQQHRLDPRASIPTRKSSPTRSAPTPSACWPTKFAQRKKW